MRKSINKPIFVIGTGRCGSTIIFEAMCVHKDLGWLSNYNKLFPRIDFASVMPRIYNIPVIGSFIRGEKEQYGQGKTFINKFLPTPFECYRKWNILCGEKFARDFLFNVKATDKEKQKVIKAFGKVLFWQGKKRFAAKYTGPARMQFVSSIFPDAKFIHIKRDARAVIYSWLNVDFWEKSGALQEPKWTGGLPENWKEEWANYGSTPLALAAMQYRAIMEVCEKEKKLLKKDQYLEIQFEDFVEKPLDTIKQILSFADLGISADVIEYVNTRNYVNTNQKYIKNIPQKEDEVLQKTVAQWCYV